jgi:hypothetical protein
MSAKFQADLRPEDPTRAVGHVAAKAAARNDEAAAIGGCGFGLGVDTGEETNLRCCHARRTWARRNVDGGGEGVDAAATSRRGETDGHCDEWSFLLARARAERGSESEEGEQRFMHFSSSAVFTSLKKNTVQTKDFPSHQTYDTCMEY